MDDTKDSLMLAINRRQFITLLIGCAQAAEQVFGLRFANF